MKTTETPSSSPVDGGDALSSSNDNNKSSDLLSFAAIVVLAANTLNGPGLTTLPAVAHAAGIPFFLLLVTLATAVTVFVVWRLNGLVWRGTAGGEQLLLRKVSDLNLEDGNEAWEAEEQDGWGKNDSGVGGLPQSSSSDRRPKAEDSSLVGLTSAAYRRSDGGGDGSARRWAAAAMVGCALSLALAQMMLCAAIGDALLVASPMGKTCGVSWSGSGPSLHCVGDSFGGGKEEKDDTSLSSSRMHPFGNDAPTSLLSVGLAFSAAVTISLASVDLDSLLNAQYALFWCLFLAAGRFCLTLASVATDSELNLHTSSSSSPFWSLGPRPFDAVGPILFNFAFVVTAPPLSREAVDGRDGGLRALSTACCVMGALYAIVGCVGAPAAAAVMGRRGGRGVAGEDNDDEAANLLSLVLSADPRSPPPAWDVAAVTLFGLSQLAAIPVYCELARETLLHHVLPPCHGEDPKVRGRRAFILSNVFPWAIVAWTYNSALFGRFVEWSSLLLLGFANFSYPLWLELRLPPGIKETRGRVSRRSRRDESRWHLLKRSTNISFVSGVEVPRVAVLCSFAIVTASIASVIVQRIGGNVQLSGTAFLLTVISGVLSDAIG